ncbi:hypothetical protein BN1184_CB_00250 [Pantoea ananatis]|nr:hypothetical protein BN1182_CT_00240 [Pantoea ananatis]CRH37122.1 hypothetical protein BN1183_CQ_00240 [Pantoea ananatis]CRH40568.1 hypothetical protein BN1184_CB_00250 [Pantoea ananatis]
MRYYSGAEIATASCATGFRIEGRAGDCAPYRYFPGRGRSLTVLIKVGVFGDETTLSEILSFVEEKTGDEYCCYNNGRSCRDRS